jgi:hypothetical protein
MVFEANRGRGKVRGKADGAQVTSGCVEHPAADGAHPAEEGWVGEAQRKRPNGGRLCGHANAHDAVGAKLEHNE